MRDEEASAILALPLEMGGKDPTLKLSSDPDTYTGVSVHTHSHTHTHTHARYSK